MPTTMDSVNRTQSSVVVHELRVELQLRDRSQPGRLVPLRVERQPVTRADARVALRPELGPGPEQREVDVEEDCLQHVDEDTRSTCGLSGPRRRGGAPRSP